MDALDDETLQNIQANENAIKSLDREKVLLQYLLSLKEKSTNELSVSQAEVLLTKSTEVLANLSAAQQINEQTTLKMHRLRHQFEQHIAPQVFGQSHTIEAQRDADRTIIIERHHQEFARLVEFYDNTSEVKELRSIEGVLKENQQQNAQLKETIKTVGSQKYVIDTQLKVLSQTFIISMINSALKERAIEKRIEAICKQSNAKEKLLFNCNKQIQDGEKKLSQLYFDINEIQNKQINLVFNLPLLNNNNNEPELPSRSPESYSFVPETEDTSLLDIVLDKSDEAVADVSVRSDAKQEIDKDVSIAAAIDRSLSALSLSGQQKRVHFDATESDQPENAELNSSVRLANDISNSQLGQLQRLQSGFTSYEFDGNVTAENLADLTADQMGSPYALNDSIDMAADLTEPTEANDSLQSWQTQPSTSKHVVKDVSFGAVGSVMNLFSTMSNVLNDTEDDQHPGAAKRAKYDFSLSQCSVAQEFTFEAFDNAEDVSEFASGGFMFNEDHTEGQDESDFLFGEPNESADKMGNLF